MTRYERKIISRKSGLRNSGTSGPRSGKLRRDNAASSKRLPFVRPQLHCAVQCRRQSSPGRSMLLWRGILCNPFGDVFARLFQRNPFTAIQRRQSLLNGLPEFQLVDGVHQSRFRRKFVRHLQENLLRAHVLKKRIVLFKSVKNVSLKTNFGIHWASWGLYIFYDTHSASRSKLDLDASSTASAWSRLTSG